MCRIGRTKKVAGNRQNKGRDRFTVNDIRHNNTVNIYSDIVSSDGIRKNDLAVKNNISLVTVNHIVNDLVRAGLAEERVCNTSIGRKPMEVHVDSQYGVIICLNLSSVHEIRYILYDLRGNMLWQNRITFRKGGDESLQDRIHEVIGEIQEKLSDIHLVTVGVAAFVPGVYYREEDKIRYALYEELTEISLYQILHDAFRVENIQILHDTYASAQSEYESTENSFRSQFYLYCGDGVGGCFMADGEIVSGNDLLAGEIGNYLFMDPEKRTPVPLEDIILIQSILKKLPAEYRYREMDTLIQMADEGDVKIQKLLGDAFQAVSMFLYNIIWIYNPSKIVIDSCCKEYADRMITRVNAFLKDRFHENIPTSMCIMPASCDEFHTMSGCMQQVLRIWIGEVTAAIEKDDAST